MPDCVDLTLDSDEDGPSGPSSRDKRRSPSTSSDVVIVDAEDVPSRQPKKARSSSAAGAAAADDMDEDIVIESETLGTVPLRDMAHSRPHCGNHTFRQSTCRDNSKRCDECYCFVCDVKAQECKYWGDGSRARDHCNAHAAHYWNSLRRAARRSNSTALLEQEFKNSSSVLTTNWPQPASTNSNGSGAAAAAAGGGAARRSLPAAGRGGSGMLSPLASLWAKKAAENNNRTPTAAGGAGAGGGGKSSGGGVTPQTAPGRLGGGASAAAAAAAAAGGGGSSVTGVAVKYELPYRKHKDGHKSSAHHSHGPKHKKSDKEKQKDKPEFPAASAWLKRMPHPRDAKSPMQLLATLELPFKTVKGVTVDEVAQRLVPTGFYRNITQHTQYGSHLVLDNLISGHYSSAKRKEVPNTLRLLPLVPADGVPPEPSTDRPYSITVISTTPGIKPCVVGVTVPLESKVSLMLSLIEDELKAQHGYGDDEGLVLSLQDNRYGEGGLSWFNAPESFKLQDQAHIVHPDSKWMAVRMPADVAQSFYNTPDNAHMWGRATPKVLLLQHQKYVDEGGSSPEQGEGAGAAAAAGATGGGAQQRRRRSHTPGMFDSEDDSYPYSDDYDSDEYDSDDPLGGIGDLARLRRRVLGAAAGGGASGGSGREERQHKVVNLGPPMAMLVPSGFDVHGGAAADKAVKEAILEHLLHYRVDSSTDAAAAGGSDGAAAAAAGGGGAGGGGGSSVAAAGGRRRSVVLKGEGGADPPSSPTSWNLKVYRYSGAERQRISIYTARINDFSQHSSDSLYVSYNSPVSKLWVHWGTDPVATPAGFDMDAFAAVPTLNDPAFEAKLKELPELVRASAEHASNIKMLRTMPQDILRELGAVCQAQAPPPTNNPADLAKITMKPSAAAVLSIFKPPSGGDGGNNKNPATSSKGGKKQACCCAGGSAVSRQVW